MNKIKIAVAGTGYVGLSMSTLLSQHNEVFAVDIVKNRVDMINNRISPIKDAYIEKFFEEKKLNLTATLDTSVYKDVEYIIICVPTNYDAEKNYFDTSAIESVIDKALESNTNATFIIKSTIPIGYCHDLYIKYGEQFNKLGKNFNLIFCPEFLCEGNALHDNLYPSRIIMGCPSESEFVNGKQVYSNNIQDKAKTFYRLLKEGSMLQTIPFLLMGLKEAESIKLFSNAYLAMRVCFFNELDTFAKTKCLNTKEIIEGVSLEPRIGSHYNNPSFGYGGYCFPKDTKQILREYDGIPQNIFSAIVNSNNTRKEFITNEIISMAQKLNDNPIIGIYRLNMKKNSDNLKFSAILDIVKQLKEQNMEVVLFEPILKNEDEFLSCKVIKDLDEFKNISTCIVANRYDKVLDDVKDKTYTSDVFFNN